MPPHTTKRRTTTHLKTKNNQNCQKIELYGSPTTKELKKMFIQTGRRGGHGQPGEKGGVAMWCLEDQAGKAAARRLSSPTFVCGLMGRTTRE